MNFLEMAVDDFSIAFFGQAKIVLKGFNDKKFNCVYIEFLFNHLARSNLRKRLLRQYICCLIKSYSDDDSDGT